MYALLVLPNGVILSGGGGESTVRAWSRGPKLVPTNVELKVGIEDDKVKPSLEWDDSPSQVFLCCLFSCHFFFVGFP